MKLILAIAASLAAGHTLTEENGRAKLEVVGDDGSSAVVTMVLPQTGSGGDPIGEARKQGDIAELTGYLLSVENYDTNNNDKSEIVGHVTYDGAKQTISCAFHNDVEFGSIAP